MFSNQGGYLNKAIEAQRRQKVNIDRMAFLLYVLSPLIRGAYTGR